MVKKGMPRQIIDDAVGLAQHQVPDDTDHQTGNGPGHQSQCADNAAALELAGQQPCQPETQHGLEHDAQNHVDGGVAQRL